MAFLITVQTFAQLSIEDCYEKAMANYPLVRQYDLIEQTRNYSLSNIGKTWLPQIQLSAKASYQSDVTKIPIDFSQVSFPQPIEMKIPELNKDQYGATVEMSQTLWDGGFSSANSKTVKANIDTEKAELDVSLYALKERVNQLFFGILLCDALIEQNRLFQDELQQKFDHINALVKSGLANQADVNAVKAEQLKAKQTFTQIAHNRKANLQMLAAFIGEKLDENISLKKPEITYLLSKEISRPELSLYDSRLVSIDAARNELKAGLMPRIGLFFTVGYGNPGLNMLKNDFSAYYIGGIRLTWNIGNLYTFKNSQNLLNSNRNAISIQRETFMFNTSLSRSSKENEIDKYREMLKLDDEIISLQSSVKLSVESKVNGGTAGVNDLIHEIIAEELAKQNKILHEIEMLQAIYSLKFIVN
ncbi:MAG: TolC family protein [Prevotellaceae bacterium]|nr:TolC family protein [Prevotellaceae bacterium]